MKARYLIFVTTIVMVGFSAGFAWGLDVSPQDSSASSIGEQITVPIVISDVGSGLSLDAFSFTIQFDSNVLEYDETNGLESAGTITEPFTLLKAEPSSRDKGLVMVNGTDFMSTYDITSPGTLVKLRFNVLALEETTLHIINFKDDIKYAGTTDAIFKPSQTTNFNPPTNLEARSGIDSIRVSWDPSNSAYLAGYNIYRASTINGSYTKLNTAGLVSDLFYNDDFNLVQGDSYFYYVTTVDTFGNESPPSDKISTIFGVIEMYIPDSNGPNGSEVRLPVNINNADGLNMCSVSIDVSYDETVLTATSIEKASLTETYGWSQNLSTPGTARAVIALNQGETLYGEGTLFYILFDVIGNPGDTSSLTFEIDTSYFYDCRDDYDEVPVNLDDFGTFTVRNGFMLGDLNGDGIIDELDFQLVLEIAVGNIELTDIYLTTGDVSGDRRIRTNDATLIMRLINGEILAFDPRSAREQRANLPSEVNIRLPSPTIIQPGGGTWVPVLIDNATGVSGAEFILNYDPMATIRPTRVRTTDLSQNFNLSYNIPQGPEETGQFRISLSSKDGKGLESGSGALVEVFFESPSDIRENTSTPIVLAGARLNDTFSRDYEVSALLVDVQTANGKVRAATLTLRDAIIILKIMTGTPTHELPYVPQKIVDGETLGLKDAIYILRSIAGL